MNNTKSIIQNNITFMSGDIPYVTASTLNNGILTYISCPKDWIEHGNCIMIGGKTLTFTYQKNDFCSNDSHNIALYLKENIFSSEKSYLFMMSSLAASLRNRYSWGDSISMKKIKKEYIYLPIIDGHLDYDYMETFISAVQKVVVRDVVLYSQEKMNALNQIVSEK